MSGTVGARARGPSLLARVRFRGVVHGVADGSASGVSTATDGGRSWVTIIEQERCHGSELELPERVSGGLERVLRINLPAQLPVTELDGLAWEALKRSGRGRLYGVWAWRRREGEGAALPEGRLLRPAMEQRGWRYLVQPRGEQVNLYLRLTDGRFHAYTFVRNGAAARLRQALRAERVASGSGVEVVEPGESSLVLGAPLVAESLTLVQPLAVSMWLGLGVRRRLVLAPALLATLWGLLAGPLLLVAAMLLGVGLSQLAGEWRQARQVEPLQAELTALQAQAERVEQSLATMEARARRWEALRGELEQGTPLLELVAAVAVALGNGGRIHSVEVTPSSASISGMAVDATAVLTAVEGMAQLRNARLRDDLSRDPNTGLEHFVIEADRIVSGVVSVVDGAVNGWSP